MMDRLQLKELFWPILYDKIPKWMTKLHRIYFIVHSNLIWEKMVHQVDCYKNIYADFFP